LFRVCFSRVWLSRVSFFLFFVCSSFLGAMAASGVDNTSRRKWNREEYIERAREREQREQEEEEAGRHRPKDRGPVVHRKPLKHRDYEVDLTARLGKTQVVTQVAPLSQQAGYFCSVCECVVKDSANYLDHINGKKHQRALGMSMRVERATLQQVQERFDILKRKKTSGSFSEQDLDIRIMKQQEEEEERKRQRREKKKEKQQREKAPSSKEDLGDEFDLEMATMMGFDGFTSSKK
jgi:U4/U6.U5 tri-snRNP component SNU23